MASTRKAGQGRGTTAKARAATAARAAKPVPRTRGKPVRAGKPGTPQPSTKQRSTAMAEKTNPPAESGDRNVDQIRDILFGGQMRDYERRFVEITQRLEQEGTRLRSDIEKRLDGLEQRLDAQLEKLGKLLRQEVGDRGKGLDDLESRLMQAARSSRSEITAALELAQQESAQADERARKALNELDASLKAAVSASNAALIGARDELRSEKVSREDLAALFTEVAMRLKGSFDLPTGK